MKRVLNVILFMLFILPIKVNALEGKLDINCDNYSVKANDEITCNITGYSNEEITGLSADIVLSSNLELINFNTDSAWQGDASENKIGLYTDINKKDNFNIGTLKVKVKDNVENLVESISLKNVIYSDALFNKVDISNVSKNIRVSSLNNYLSSLTINPGSINFDKNKLSYDVTVESSYIEVSCEKESPLSTLSGDIGKRTLEYGKNVLKIYVTSEGGSAREYILNVTRLDNRNTENRLSSIGINGNSINFNSDKTEYNISVENDVTVAKITANLKDDTSKFVSGYGPRNINLNEGNNKIELRVISENGITRIYSITINRKEDPNNKSNDNYLKELEIKDKVLDFDKNKKNYELTVDYDTKKLDINAVSSSNKSNVEIIGNDDLKVGKNEIIVKVTAKDNSVREYKIIVTRKDKNVILDNNSFLKSITISGYQINFNKNTYNYTLKIKDEDSLDIKVDTESNVAKVKIVGNNNLNNNNIIKIIVTAEDKTTSTYSITVNKGSSINYLLIAVIIESIVIVVIFMYLILKKKSDNNEKV